MNFRFFSGLRDRHSQFFELLPRFAVPMIFSLLFDFPVFSLDRQRRYLSVFLQGCRRLDP